MCSSFAPAFTALAAIGLIAGQTPAQNAPSAFTYQGQLRFNNATVVGPVDFEFKMFDAAAGGKQIGPILSAQRVPLQNGRFAVQLDFGATPFGGESRWIEIALRTAGTDNADFTTLTPRQLLSNSSYTIQGGASTLAGATREIPQSGSPGVAGPQGPQGERGDKGDKGAQGPQGEPGQIGAVGPMGPTGAHGLAGIAGGSSGSIPLVSSYVVGPKDSGAAFTSIQSAIDKAGKDGASAAAPVVILVRPGTFRENIKLLSGVHIQGVVTGRSFAATVMGTVTAAMGDGGAASWNSVNINSEDGPAVLMSGAVSQQLFINQSVLYSSKASVLDLSGGGSISARSVTLQVINNAAEPAITCRGGSVLVEDGLVGASALDRMAVRGTAAARIVLKNLDIRGAIEIDDDASLTLRASEVQSGQGPAVLARQSKTGLVLLTDSSLVTTRSPTILDSGDGPVLYAYLIFSGGGIGMPETAFKLPGSDSAIEKPAK